MTHSQSYAELLYSIFLGKNNEFKSLDEYLYGTYGEGESPNFVCDKDGERIGVQLDLCGGNPTVWLDTNAQNVICPTDHSCAVIGRDLCEAIEEYFGLGC